MDDLKVEWLRSPSRRRFTLLPFRVVGGDEEGTSLVIKGRVADASWLLVSAFNGRAVIQRHRTTQEGAGAAAVALAAMRGDSTIIARQVGLTGKGAPIFESVGQVLTRKADPLSVEAFEEWAEQIAAQMYSVSRADLAAVATEALDHLSLNFATANASQIEQALRGYRTTIASPPARMLEAQRLELSKTLRNVLRETGVRTKRFPQVRANIAAGFAVKDREASSLLSRHHSFWVRNQHGAISESMSRMARSIISGGVDRGLGRNDIGRELSQMTANGLRQPHYYRTVAANQVSRARSYSMGTTMRAAGIEFFRIEAVLDIRTTYECEFLHKKVIPLGPSVEAIERVMASPNPEAVLTEQPFVRDRGDRLTIGDTTLARIESRGERSTDTRSVFSGGLSRSDMVDAGVGFPPYHHSCRTTVVPHP